MSKVTTTTTTKRFTLDLSQDEADMLASILGNGLHGLPECYEWSSIHDALVANGADNQRFRVSPLGGGLFVYILEERR